MKKNVILILMAVLCIAAIGVFSGCGNGDTGEKGDKGDKGDAGIGFNETLTIYKINDTAFAYSGNMPIYKFKYESKTATEATFSITNISIPYNAFAIRYWLLDADMQGEDYDYIDDADIEYSEFTIGTTTNVLIPINGYKYLLFQHAANEMPLVIFQI